MTALADEALHHVEALPDRHFRGDDWIDRQTFLADLRCTMHVAEHLPAWQRNPQVHCDRAVGAVFELIARDPERLPEKHRAVESRLAQIPRFLREGLRCLQRPVPLWKRLAVRAAQGADSFLKGLDAPLTACSGNAPRTRALLAGARNAFHDYAQAVAGLATGPADGFALGHEGFELMIRNRMAESWSVAEVMAMGRELIEHTRAELRDEARKLGGGDGAKMVERFRQSWNPGDQPLIAQYREATEAIRSAVIRKGLVTVPSGESLKVLPVPDFLRHQFPTAAYSAPGAFAQEQIGIFWVNDLSLTRRHATERDAERRQHFGLELTAAHEAYPGHHLQFIVQNRHPSPTRRLASHAVYYEGWTLWWEKLAIEEGLFEAPHARLIQCYDALWRACRIVIDAGIHSREMSLAQARQLLVKEVGFTPSRAQGDLNWYTSSPTVPMSYLLGRLEMERLYEEKVRANGWSLCRFHDWVLSFGAVPWNWIRRSGL